jgi:tetratricopeptide (TPR) repeat protein
MAELRYGPQSRAALEYRASLAVFDLELGRTEEARRSIQELIHHLALNKADSPLALMDSAITLLRVALAEGKDAEIRTKLKDLQEIRQGLTKNKQIGLSVRRNLRANEALAYSALGQHSTAAHLMGRVVKAFHKSVGPIARAIRMRNYASILRKRGNVRGARNQIDEAFRELSVFPPNHPVFAAPLAERAEIRLKHEFRAAIKDLKQAIVIRRKSHGSTAPATMRLQERLKAIQFSVCTNARSRG